MDNSKITVWSLVQNNDFEEACQKADEEYAEEGFTPTLRNKVYALFHLKRYLDVIQLSEKLIEVEKGESSSDFQSAGIANWIIGDLSKAIELWENAQNCMYQDAAGGIDTQVLLYFAAIKTKQDKLRQTAVRTIKKLLKSKRSINYPGPLGHYLLNDITEEQLISYVANVPILRERQLCQAQFVSAIKILETEDVDGYYKKLKECVSYGPSSYLEHEYYLAKGELENRPRNSNSLVQFFKRALRK
ncbi:hypothetical protein [uncultured Mucilaginibacter sp.]|uniref:hypothetical protein n=1 Tax=uncultured Mucilaginibacter sp. TaxID=797541 RepID=UPI0025E4AD66|nr:hypothetical protein [uncultured Mucilaginibacter sp.]